MNEQERGPELVVHRNAAAGETMLVHPVGPGRAALRVELVIEAAHHAPPAHVHPHAVETFTVLEGELWVRVGRRRATLVAGESVAVPAGVTHGYAGVPGVAARVAVEVVPPGRMAEFFAAIYGLPADQRVAATGAPRLRAVAPIVRDHLDDIRLPGLPAMVARPLLGLLALGRG